MINDMLIFLFGAVNAVNLSSVPQYVTRPPKMSHSDTSGDFEIFVPTLSTLIALQNNTKFIMIPVVVAELWQCKRACMGNECFEKMTFKV